jgi:hypothetical protein
MAAVRCSEVDYMHSACIVCIAGGLDGRRPSKKNPRMHALLQEIVLDNIPFVAEVGSGKAFDP